jgi:RNA polymerase sigma-70 factor, ECF subfamily
MTRETATIETGAEAQASSRPVQSSLRTVQVEAGSPEVVDLVERAREGDREAFAALYRAYLPTVYKFLYYRLNGNKAMAEDMTGETFVRALRKIGDYNVTGADFGAWLVRIARNLIYDNAKSARHRLEQLSEKFPEASMGATETTEDEVVSGIEQGEVVRAIQHLSPDQRDVVTMRFLQGMEVSEVAEALGKKEGTIRTLQFRGLKSLQKVLVKHQIVDPTEWGINPSGVRESTNGRTGDVTESEAARYGISDGER